MAPPPESDSPIPIAGRRRRCSRRAAMSVGWRWSPVRARASAGPPHGDWPPKARRWPAWTWWRKRSSRWRPRSTRKPRRRGVGPSLCAVTSPTKTWWRGHGGGQGHGRAGPDHQPGVRQHRAGIGGFAHTHRHHGRSAGIGTRSSAVNLDRSTGSWCAGPSLLTLLEHGGSITNTVVHRRRDGPARTRRPTAPPRAASHMLTKALAVEYMARGVRVRTQWNRAAWTRRWSTTSARPRGPTPIGSASDRIMTPIGLRLPGTRSPAPFAPSRPRTRPATSRARSSPSTERLRPERCARLAGCRVHARPDGRPTRAGAAHGGARRHAAARATHRRRSRSAPGALGGPGGTGPTLAVRAPSP